jgi:hypothetical protein
MKSIILKNISLTTLAVAVSLAVTPGANAGSLASPSARSRGGAVHLQPKQAPPGSLWYNGDFDGINGLANEQNTIVSDSRIYDDFNVTDAEGWTVTAVFSDNLADTGITGANYEIRQGVSEGNGGTVVASGTTNSPVVTPTGRDGFGYIEYMVEIDGLNIHLDQGTYWLNVTPIGDFNGRSFVSTTSGADCVGSPCGDNDNAFWDSTYYGFNFAEVGTIVDGAHDVSMGVIGTGGGGGGIVLTADVHRRGGKRFVSLHWSPADGGTVNILKNDTVAVTTDDDGAVQDFLRTATGTFYYQVCETDSGDCSNVVRVISR